jgi:hypothetical protein
MIARQHSYPIARSAARSTCIGAAAGFMGGLAEIAWIALFAQVSGTSAAAVARGVAQTVFPYAANWSLLVPLGLALHMGIAMALGIAITLVVRSMALQPQSPTREAVLVVCTLVIVWAINFLVVLPAINPDFVQLLPNGISLASKVLFGVAAASVLQLRRSSRHIFVV